MMRSVSSTAVFYMAHKEHTEYLSQAPPSPDDINAAISHLAYEMYLERGGGHSSDEQRQQDWSTAEMLYHAGISDLHPKPPAVPVATE